MTTPLPNYTTDFKPPFTVRDGHTLYAASYRELPACIAQGTTPQEALEALRELAQITVDQLRAAGQPIPDPLPAASYKVLSLGTVQPVDLAGGVKLERGTDNAGPLSTGSEGRPNVPAGDFSYA